MKTTNSRLRLSRKTELKIDNNDSIEHGITKRLIEKYKYKGIYNLEIMNCGTEKNRKA